MRTRLRSRSIFSTTTICDPMLTVSFSWKLKANTWVTSSPIQDFHDLGCAPIRISCNLRSSERHPSPSKKRSSSRLFTVSQKSDRSIVTTTSEFPTVDFHSDLRFDLGNIQTPVALERLLREEVLPDPFFTGQLLQKLMENDFVLAQWIVAPVSTLRLLNQPIAPSCVRPTGMISSFPCESSRHSSRKH